MKRYYVIDALRAVLALCVVLGHTGVLPLFGAVGQPDHALDLIARAWRTLAFGPPAVIGFFVISGFCIHLPFAGGGRKVPLLRFYARRYLRILVPLLTVVAVYKIVWPDAVILGEHSILWHSTLWSIVCEELYYAAYPFLNRLRARSGWLPLIALAFVAAAAIDLAYPSARDWEDLGIVYTTLVLSPVWLLGCLLAETVAARGSGSRVSIWLWRLGVWSAMWVAGIAHFHAGLYQTQSGVLLGVLAYFWLRAELRHERESAPWPLLVWAGRWSYSLYLVHPIVISLFGLSVLAGSPLLTWVVLLLAVLTASYVFYLLVERPSHRLARKVSLFEGATQQVRTSPV